MIAERDECLDLATEATEKLKTAVVDLALQSTLREAALKEKNAHTAEIAGLQE